ncbi:MAG: hydrogen peroxide-inducible genes activator [Rhodospirillaceae bacterium]
MRLLPTLKQLEYLDALDQTGHFGRAAERCSVTPSTLSAGIRELEDLLGVAVAERTKRVVLMTEVGRTLAARARDVLQGAEDLMALARAHGEPLAGDLNLGVIPTVGPFLLPHTLPALNAAYPKLRIYLREAQTVEVLARLRAGTLDLGLIALPWEIEGLQVRPLFDDGFRLACHADHPFATRDAVGIDDLAGEPLLLLEEGHCLRGHALDACRLSSSALRGQVEATSLATLVQMVAAGLGVTLLPEIAIAAGITAGTAIRLVPLTEPASRQIGLVWRATSPRGAAFERIAATIAAAA